MNTLSRSFRTHPVVYFVVLACLFGWSLFIAWLLGADLSPNGMPLGPIMAAAVVSAVMGRSDLRDWGRRLLTFRTSFGWYALAFLAPAVIVTTAVLANSALGAPLPTSAQLAGWSGLPVEFLSILILIGIGEEAGWTAFAASRLLSRRSFIETWLILSAIRILWHIPLMLRGELPPVLGIGGNAAFQFLLLWVFQRSDGVWFLAAIWHTMHNTVSGTFFFQLVEGADRARLGVLVTACYAVAAVVVYLVGYRRLKASPGFGSEGL